MNFPRLQHGVIYADPPWYFKNYSEKGEEKNAVEQYPCMEMADLLAMRDDVLFVTAPNAVCVMWATFPMLQQALEVLNAWGFKYCTGGPWVKRTKHGKKSFGTGYVLRSSAECFLIGTNGDPRIKNRSTRNLLDTGDVMAFDDIDSVIVDTIRREHSRKPDEMIDLIENLFEGPYLELFARTRREGWNAWGNQVERFAA